MKIVYDLKNKNINHIIHNSIYFANWAHGCIGVPEEISNTQKEFILVTMSFDKNADENSIPSESPNVQENNYSIQFFFSTTGKIYFRIFDWANQKYPKWKILFNDENSVSM